MRPERPIVSWVLSDSFIRRLEMKSSNLLPNGNSVSETKRVGLEGIGRLYEQAAQMPVLLLLSFNPILWSPGSSSWQLSKKNMSLVYKWVHMIKADTVVLKPRWRLTMNEKRDWATEIVKSLELENPSSGQNFELYVLLPVMFGVEDDQR